VESLRADFKKILQYIAEGTPQPRKEETKRGELELELGEWSEPDTTLQSEGSWEKRRRTKPPVDNRKIGTAFGSGGARQRGSDWKTRTQTAPNTRGHTTGGGGEQLKGVIGGGLVKEDPIVLDTSKLGKHNTRGQVSREEGVGDKRRG